MRRHFCRSRKTVVQSQISRSSYLKDCAFLNLVVLLELDSEVWTCAFYIDYMDQALDVALIIWVESPDRESISISYGSFLMGFIPLGDFQDLHSVGAAS